MFLVTTGVVAAIQEDLDSVEEMNTILTTINRTLDTRLTGLETQGKDSMGEDNRIVWAVEGKGILISFGATLETVFERKHWRGICVLISNNRAY